MMVAAITNYNFISATYDDVISGENKYFFLLTLHFVKVFSHKKPKLCVTMSRRIKPAIWEEFNPDDGIQLANRDRSYYEHRQRLHRARSKINQDTPRSFPKLQGNRIGTFTTEEYHEIQRNNKRLLNRLTAISYKKSRFSKIKAPRKASKSLNQTKKKKEMDRIDRENRFLVTRIMNCKSTINHRQINRDWNRSRNIINNHNAAKRKRKNFRPNKLMPLTLSNTSSASSTPLNSSRQHYHQNNPYSLNLNNLNQNDMEILRNLSPNTLQKLTNLREPQNGPAPLDPIIEKSDDMKSNPSTNNPTYRSFREKYLNDALAQINFNNNNHPNPPNFNNINMNMMQTHNNERSMHSDSDQMLTSHNLLFKASQPQNQGQAQMEVSKYKEEVEEKDKAEEVESDWEHDDEWKRKESQQMENMKQRPSKTITIGLPLI